MTSELHLPKHRGEEPGRGQDAPSSTQICDRRRPSLLPPRSPVEQSERNREDRRSEKEKKYILLEKKKGKQKPLCVPHPTRRLLFLPGDEQATILGRGRGASRAVYVCRRGASRTQLIEHGTAAAGSMGALCSAGGLRRAAVPSWDANGAGRSCL